MEERSMKRNGTRMPAAAIATVADSRAQLGGSGLLKELVLSEGGEDVRTGLGGPNPPRGLFLQRQPKLPAAKALGLQVNLPELLIHANIRKFF